MPKQQGPCAFSNACFWPGPHARLQQSNLTFCPRHLRAVQSFAFAGSGSLEAARIVVPRGGDGVQPFSGWAYSGVVARK